MSVLQAYYIRSPTRPALSNGKKMRCVCPSTETRDWSIWHKTHEIFLRRIALPEKPKRLYASDRFIPLQVPETLQTENHQHYRKKIPKPHSPDTTPKKGKNYNKIRKITPKLQFLCVSLIFPFLGGWLGEGILVIVR